MKKKSKSVITQIGQAVAAGAEAVYDAGAAAVHAVGEIMPTGKTPTKKAKTSSKPASLSKTEPANTSVTAKKVASPTKAAVSKKPKSSAVNASSKPAAPAGKATPTTSKAKATPAVSKTNAKAPTPKAAPKKAAGKRG